MQFLNDRLFRNQPDIVSSRDPPDLKTSFYFTIGMLFSQVRSSALSSFSPSPHLVEWRPEWRLRPWSLLRWGRSKPCHLIKLANKTSRDLNDFAQIIFSWPWLPLVSKYFVLLSVSSTVVLHDRIFQRLRLLLLQWGRGIRPYLANIGRIRLLLSETMERQVFVVPSRANK